MVPSSSSSSSSPGFAAPALEEQDFASEDLRRSQIKADISRHRSILKGLKLELHLLDAADLDPDRRMVADRDANAAPSRPGRVVLDDSFERGRLAPGLSRSRRGGPHGSCCGDGRSDNARERADGIPVQMSQRIQKECRNV